MRENRSTYPFGGFVTIGNELVTVHKVFLGHLLMDYSYSGGRSYHTLEEGKRSPLTARPLTVYFITTLPFVRPFRFLRKEFLALSKNGAFS